MPKLTRVLITVPVLVTILVCVTLCPCRATQFKSVDNFFFPDTAIIDDDLFIAGGNIKLDGIIEGDLVAAGGSLVQSGLVLGSLNAASQDIDVLGEVRGSVRGFAQNINVNGRLSRNLLAFGYLVDIKPEAQIQRDVTAYCGKLTLHGTVGGDVKGGVGELVISGQVEGNVNVKADKITLMPTARISGDLRYTCDKEAQIEPGAQIAGETVWTRKETGKKKPTSIFTGKPLIPEILFLLALMITGIVLTVLCRKNAYLAKQSVGDSFLKSLGLGFVFLICIPIAILVMMVTVIGMPIAIISLFAYLVLVYVAKIPVATFLGERILRALGAKEKISLIWSMILGLVVLTLLSNVPYLEWPIYFVILFTGFGAIITSQRRSGAQGKSGEEG
jgi:cytoskeletal protein CcmA (bactofilin family)